MAEWAPYQGRGGLPRQQPQACNQLGATTRKAGLHLGHTRSFDARASLLPAPEAAGHPAVLEPREVGVGKKNPPPPLQSPRPPWQETPQAAGTGKCLRTHLGHSPASSQACSSPRRVCEGGQCQQHRPHVHPQEEDILPEEPQHWLSLCSLPGGLSWPVQVFKVGGSSQTSLQASSPNSVLPFPSPSPGRIS